MKKAIFFIVFLSIVLKTNAQQKHFEILGGVSFPLLSFANQNIQNQNAGFANPFASFTCRYTPFTHGWNKNNFQKLFISCPGSRVVIVSEDLEYFIQYQFHSYILSPTVKNYIDKSLNSEYIYNSSQTALSMSQDKWMQHDLGIGFKKRLPLIASYLYFYPLLSVGITYLISPQITYSFIDDLSILRAYKISYSNIFGATAHAGGGIEFTIPNFSILAECSAHYFYPLQSSIKTTIGNDNSQNTSKVNLFILSLHPQIGIVFNF